MFVFAQDYLNIPQKTIKATVLIETILASFELNEILWELRDHSAGLNCGRWDYIFSYIKKFKNLPGFILPCNSWVLFICFFVFFLRSVLVLALKVLSKNWKVLATKLSCCCMKILMINQFCDSEHADSSKQILTQFLSSPLHRKHRLQSPPHNWVSLFCYVSEMAVSDLIIKIVVHLA